MDDFSDFGDNMISGMIVYIEEGLGQTFTDNNNSTILILTSRPSA